MGEPLKPIPLTPGGYLKPWTLRARLIPSRTYSGRVVYKRRPHFFSLRDIERISEGFQLQPGQVIEEPDTWCGRLVRALWKVIFKIVPRPAFLDPFVEPFISWYTRVTNAASMTGSYSDWEFWSRRACRILMDDMASAFGEAIGDFVKEDYYGR